MFVGMLQIQNNERHGDTIQRRANSEAYPAPPSRALSTSLKPPPLPPALVLPAAAADPMPSLARNAHDPCKSTFDTRGKPPSMPDTSAEMPSQYLSPSSREMRESTGAAEVASVPPVVPGLEPDMAYRLAYPAVAFFTVLG